jgi:hypothetical protein
MTTEKVAEIRPIVENLEDQRNNARRISEEELKKG